ncbi:hypothetical protein GF325_06555 [Candidatus Bathyarchaeota archaeon]|nr:hypothetical protein [Candidatus Bathyarchaeota archaeon]
MEGFQFEWHVEIYEGYPVIRHWLTVKNDGSHWMKIDHLKTTCLDFSGILPRNVPLTPSERGASASILALENQAGTTGIIAGSEVPSAIRFMDGNGTMGYTDEFFEWVLGPGERFTTEPCFVLGYSDCILKTCSAHSFPRDRAVEDSLVPFIEKVLNIPADPSKMPVPLWCTWSNFSSNINAAIIEQQAKLAARCGFTGFQIDAGWSESITGSDWTCGSRVPDPVKFPDFKKTCAIVLDLGLKLGLWLSCYRHLHSPDLQDLPGARSLPLVVRGEGFGMSFASTWADYYARDLLHLVHEYGATYFKQDLTNIKFGDIGFGHASRTRKESYLKAIRGFFRSQDAVHHVEPDICLLLSHELYWGTPGVPCDLAAVKHCWSYHVPPNDYSGAFPRSRRITRQEKRLKFNRFQLLKGCFNARRRFYAHRGLPLYCIEYYGAATVNKDGSLSPDIIDRQVCSWLMGIPSVYAGDLSTLTERNIDHYRKRLNLLRSLHDQHGIYKYFQFSGVPSPTRFGWHWWGKLNPRGEGVVVVMRGRFNLFKKKARINIPWVNPGKTYEVSSLFKTPSPGTFTGDELQQGRLRLALPRAGQEILELRLAG